jgi:CheY-like chemotaxis protein
MPLLTGSQMALRIRDIRPEMPILLMSGYVGPNLLALARRVHVNVVLAKPLAARDIARALASLFGP